MKKYLVFLLLPHLGFAAETRAKNVILFLGDAGGIPTLNVAGIYAHNRPLGLFLQSMPYLALSDTSSLDNWVTDSAAGMTAIVTGHKTNNGMLSLLPGLDGAAGQPVKTILEYAEERGLATGVVTNRPCNSYSVPGDRSSYRCTTTPSSVVSWSTIRSSATVVMSIARHRIPTTVARPAEAPVRA